MHENLRQGWAFLAVGGAATLTHAAVALFAAQMMGLPPLTANLVGYASAVGLSYTANARLTFRRAARDAGQFARFLTVSLAMLALNQAMVFLLVEGALWPFWAALIPVVTVVPVVSFVLSKLWAFRPGLTAPAARAFCDLIESRGIPKSLDG